MDKISLNVLLILIFSFPNLLLAKDHSSEWEIAKMEMKDSAYEDALKLFKGDKCKALAWSNCVIQGRAEAGIKGNCKYLLEKDSDKNQHLLDQDKCFKKVGYDSVKRKAIGKNCTDTAIKACK